MPRNIILFLTDQWRWDTLNDAGSPVQLPNLQTFSTTAINYTNSYSPVPLCTPARGCLFTGKWPHQTGTMDNVQGRSYYPQGCLHREQTTYLERLQDSGYSVCYIGKWHLGDGGLLERGLTEVRRSDGGDEPIGTKPANLHFEGPSAFPYYATVSSGETADGLRVADAISYINKMASSVEPFCLVVSLHGPHFPHHVPKQFVELYNNLPADYVPPNFCKQFSESGKPLAQSRSYWPCQETADLSQEDWRRTAQHYYGFCSYIDALFGQFHQAIKHNGFEDNTVLAFTADHGEMLGAHGWFDKGPFFYDEVIRIPMLIRTPAGKQNIASDNFVSLKDLWPTLADAANATDMLEHDELKRSYSRSNETFVTYCYDSYQGRQFRLRGIRNERYKYTWSPNDMPELYDLKIDSQERINVAGQSEYTDIQADLHSQLFAWMERESDYLRIPTHHLPIGSYVDGRDRSFDPENQLPGRD